MSVRSNSWHALLDAARRWPERTALVFPHASQSLTFQEWHSAAAELAGGLQQMGMQRGDHIALLAENRAEWAVVQLAVAAIGAIFVPLNTHYRREDLLQALQAGDVVAVIASAGFRSNQYWQMLQEIRAQVPTLQHVIDIEQLPAGTLDESAGCSDIDSVHNCPGDSSPVHESPGSTQKPAAILYTSGTTGVPKGALLSHQAMLANAAITADRLGLQTGDRWTSIIPLFHCAGCIMNLLGCLQTGATYVGVPSFDPENMFSVIESQRCTHLSGVPTSWLAMLDHPARSRYKLDSLRGGTCGGADASADVLKRCASEFPVAGLVQVYGQTEGATLLTCPRSDSTERFDTAGPALDGYELRIIDPLSGEACDSGCIGEVQGRGSMVMLGYYNRPDATAETITADCWLRTGDLGFLTDQGNLVIAGGRLRDMIIRGGENIYPVEIENCLIRHPAIDQLAVFAMPDDYYGEIVAAAVQLNDEKAGVINSASLAQFCADKIARFKVPAVWFRCSTFPLTASGKIRKTELQTLATQQQLEHLD